MPGPPSACPRCPATRRSRSRACSRSAERARQARHRGGTAMAPYVICHGAWSAGWAWEKLRPPLRAAGHEVFTPTYTGLGERAHLAHPLVDLETHVQDILALIEAEGLRDIL